MTNILPLDAQKNLWRLYRSRFLAVFALLLCGLAVLAIISLLPSYVALRLAAPTKDAVTQAATAAEDTKNMTRAQAEVGVLNSIVNATTSPSRTIDTILSLRPRGMSIEHILFTNGTQKQIILEGMAPRGILNAFRATLEGQHIFKSVSVPVGSLVGTDNGRFTITLTGDF